MLQNPQIMKINNVYLYRSGAVVAFAAVSRFVLLRAK